MPKVICYFDRSNLDPEREWEPGEMRRTIEFSAVPRVGETVAFPNYDGWKASYGNWRVLLVMWSPGDGLNKNEMWPAITLSPLPSGESGT